MPKVAKTKNSKTHIKSKIEARALGIRTRTGINRLRQDLWYHSFLHTPKTQKLKGGAPPLEIFIRQDFMGGAPPLEIFIRQYFMGGAPPLESGCAK